MSASGETYTRKEILVGLCDYDGKVDEREHVREGVLEHGPDTAPGASFVVLGDTAGRYRLSICGHLGLFGSKEVCSGVAGEIRNEPEGYKPN